MREEGRRMDEKDFYRLLVKEVMERRT